jgi:hypothetical protein
MRVVKEMGVVPRQSSLEIEADSREEPTLNVDDFDGSGTIRTIIHHGIDPRADGIAPHRRYIVGLQQFRRPQPYSSCWDRVTGHWNLDQE